MKDFTERLVELIKDDPELHGAAVRLLNSMADLNEQNAMRIKIKNAEKKILP